MDERLKDSASYQAYMRSLYKSIKHLTYFNVYDELFSRYRGRDITFVEIGVFGGGSLFTSPAKYVHHGNKLASIADSIPSWAKNLKSIQILNFIGKKITSSIYNKTGGTDRLRYFFSKLRK